MLPLLWRQVDFGGGEIRLDPHSTKNDERRTFPMTAALRTLLEEQSAEHERLKRAGHLCPHVFFREVEEGRGATKRPRRIISFNKAWRSPCHQAGCPGRIPHDLRRTAVRNLVWAGVPESVAMQLTGHKTRSVFERYNIVSTIDLRDAAARLDAALGDRSSDHSSTADTLPASPPSNFFRKVGGAARILNRGWGSCRAKDTRNQAGDCESPARSSLVCCLA